MTRFERAKEALIIFFEELVDAQAAAAEAEFRFDRARLPREFSRNFYRDAVGAQGIGE